MSDIGYWWNSVGRCRGRCSSQRCCSQACCSCSNGTGRSVPVVRGVVALKRVVARILQPDAAVVVRVSGVVRKRVVVARTVQVDAVVVVRGGIPCERVVARSVQLDAVVVVRGGVALKRVVARIVQLDAVVVVDMVMIAKISDVIVTISRIFICSPPLLLYRPFRHRYSDAL